MYRALADLLVVLHLAFILAVVAGGFLVLRRPRLAWVHLPVVVWGFAVEITGWVCPLTPWEQDLRAAAGEGGYDGGFIDHYLVPLIYPDGMSAVTRYAYAAIVVAVNAAIYLRLWRKQKNGKESGTIP